VPQAAVVNQHTSSRPSNLELPWIESIGGDPVVARRIVAEPVALRHHQSSTVIGTEGRNHPESCQLQYLVWAGWGKTDLKPLIARPVRVPLPPIGARMVDDTSTDAHPNVTAQKRFGYIQDLPIS